MPIRLTNEIIDQRLLVQERTIKRVGDYKNNRSKIEWQCLICNCVWSANAANVISNGTGCPDCAKPKITNETIDQILRDQNRNIKRISDCNNADSETKIEWQCLDCDFRWRTTWYCISYRHNGCSKCATAKSKLTNETIDQRLLGRNVKRAGDYPGSIKLKMKWDCLDCGFNWNARVGDVVNGGCGCPQCGGKIPLTNEIIDQRLVNRNIKRIGEFVDSNAPLSWQCTDCNYCWLTTPAHVLHISGCPACANVAQLTNDIIDQRLVKQNRAIQRIGNVINSKTPIKWECLKCNFDWDATPDHIFNNFVDCPNCTTISSGERIIHSILFSKKIQFNHSQRLKQLNKQYPNFIVDFYIPSSNLFIEYNGAQHYFPVQFGSMSKEESEEKFVKQVKRDGELQTFAIENKINLVFIDGRKYKGTKLKKYFSKLIDEVLK